MRLLCRAAYGLIFKRAPFTSLVAYSRRRVLLPKLQVCLRSVQVQGIGMEESGTEPEQKQACGSSSGSTSDREVKKPKRPFDFNM